MIAVIKTQDLLNTDLKHFLRDGGGLVVVCENEIASKNVVMYLKASQPFINGLQTRAGLDIYEETSDFTRYEFIFMIPSNMSVKHAISETREKLEQTRKTTIGTFI